jgi:hypothetical protein
MWVRCLEYLSALSLERCKMFHRRQSWHGTRERRQFPERTSFHSAGNPAQPDVVASANNVGDDFVAGGIHFRRSKTRRVNHFAPHSPPSQSFFSWLLAAKEVPAASSNTFILDHQHWKRSSRQFGICGQIGAAFNTCVPSSNFQVVHKTFTASN